AASLAAAPARAGELGPERARLAALAQAAPDLDPGVLERALHAAACAERRGLLDDPDTLTVIDYTRPSTEPRLFVLDVDAPALLHEELVAHGRGTGENDARGFPNDPGGRPRGPGGRAGGAASRASASSCRRAPTSGATGARSACSASSAA